VTLDDLLDLLQKTLPIGDLQRCNRHVTLGWCPHIFQRGKKITPIVTRN
jgi:hypothetical protein